MGNYKELGDYGIIGNFDTCALVSNDGSIDWCCFPHIESPSVFAAILDVDKGGHFSIMPAGSFSSESTYIKNTNVLKTVFRSPSGVIELVDFMPLKIEGKRDELAHQLICRKVTCRQGSIRLKISFKPRFNYAQAKTNVRTAKGGILAASTCNQIFLTAPLGFQIKDDEAIGTFLVKEDDEFWMALQYGANMPTNLSVCQSLLDDTIQHWTDWSHKCDLSKCVFAGEWHDLITRSGLVLKLLTHHQTGAICAAPTTSLPEKIGGNRNWDYRYNWIRDAFFTVQALYNLGHISEAKKHLKWFTDICRRAKEPSEIQVLYGMHGETDLEEQELKHLSGYQDSWPVRIGNKAVDQKQLDIYGELVNAIYETSRYGEEISSDIWQFIKKVVDYVCQIWKSKDASIWEMRGEPRHFVYSKLMCWVAVDRGIKIARRKSFNIPLKKWLKVKTEIREAILKRGFNKRLNSFVQSFDSENLDATNLLIPIMGFLPFSDLRIQGTINTTLSELMENGLVRRYNGDDGLPGKEGAFVLCSFWLVDALALSGRLEEAETIFRNILKYISPLGLFSEEIEAKTGRLLGNFPQAFSHIGLINSALYLNIAKNQAAPYKPKN
jgi:GH15 family glucan-1,4-alpha-glucosidase